MNIVLGEPEKAEAEKVDVAKMTEQECANYCSKRVMDGNAALTKTTVGYMEFGEILEELLGPAEINDDDVDRKRLWKYHVKNFQTKAEFIKEAFRISISMADHIRRVTKKYKPYIGNRFVPFSRLLNALPYVNDNNVVEVIACASEHLADDWKKDLKDLKKIEIIECLHEKTERWERCLNPDCGKWLGKVKD